MNEILAEYIGSAESWHPHHRQAQCIRCRGEESRERLLDILGVCIECRRGELEMGTQEPPVTRDFARPR